MSSPEIFIMCPFCRSLDVYEKKEMYAETMKLLVPGNNPRAVELKIFACRECGRMFSAGEGRGEEERH